MVHRTNKRNFELKSADNAEEAKLRPLNLPSSQLLRLTLSLMPKKDDKAEKLNKSAAALALLCDTLADFVILLEALGILK